MTTEDEARKMWCPFVQVALAQSHGAFGHSSSSRTNRPPETYRDGRNIKLDGPNCIAADCMAWRWKKVSNVFSTTHGHCGLAGQQ